MASSGKNADADNMETDSSPKAPDNRRMMEREKYKWEEKIEPHLTIAIVGQRGCGKSTLILTATKQILPHPDEKFVSKRYPLKVEADGVKYNCMVADIGDWEEKEARREKVYSEKPVVFLLCYRDSSAKQPLKDRWVADFQKHDVPYFLVGIKKTKEWTFVSEDNEHLLVCYPYLNQGVERVFEEAVKTALEHYPQLNRKS